MSRKKRRIRRLLRASCEKDIMLGGQYFVSALSGQRVIATFVARCTSIDHRGRIRFDNDVIIYGASAICCMMINKPADEHPAEQ